MYIWNNFCVKFLKDLLRDYYRYIFRGGISYNRNYKTQQFIENIFINLFNNSIILAFAYIVIAAVQRKWYLVPNMKILSPWSMKVLTYLNQILLYFTTTHNVCLNGDHVWTLHEHYALCWFAIKSRICSLSISAPCSFGNLDEV